MVEIKKDKLKVEIFVPIGSCACSFAPLLEKVGRVTTKYKDSVEVKMKSINLTENSKSVALEAFIIVDGTIKLSARFEEMELEDAILRRRPHEQ